MLEDNLLPFNFPAVERKKVTAAFDGGRITSDGGVMLLAAVEKELGLAERLAPLITDPRNPLSVTHRVADILRARILAIACGYEDGDDLDLLRTDPGSNWPADVCPTAAPIFARSQPSRWENAPSPREVIRMTYAIIDTYCASYKRPPRAVTLDIDDTLDVVHGHQQLSLFNAHCDERCSLPIHVYDTATSVSVPGSGGESVCWRVRYDGVGEWPSDRSTGRLRWSCNTSTRADGGSDDRGETGANRASGEGR